MIETCIVIPEIIVAILVVLIVIPNAGLSTIALINTQFWSLKSYYDNGLWYFDPEYNNSFWVLLRFVFGIICIIIMAAVASVYMYSLIPCVVIV